ncbi:MAG: DUF3800 domain-containing protein [Candidatus Pacebacteria bacterium]|nr:DUF3800 domain-containing protein [Candidatus Paceibacterota bacterium]
MYIYLDESYNLRDRNKKQFISINGFAVLDEKNLFKKWKEYRYPFIGKRRIHANDSTFNDLRLKTLKLIGRFDLTLLSVFQIIQEISFKREKGYFRKNKLDFEKIYFDLLKVLFGKLKLGEYKSVKIIIDNRKCKGGLLAKKTFRKEIKKFLKETHAQTKIEFKIQSSTTDILLEFADFISNIFYRAYIKDDEKFFEDLKFKMVQIKNPLK